MMRSRSFATLTPLRGPRRALLRMTILQGCCSRGSQEPTGHALPRGQILWECLADGDFLAPLFLIHGLIRPGDEFLEGVKTDVCGSGVADAEAERKTP